MSDNFNLAKFLRNNPLLNEGIGGYVDLRPINSISEDDSFIQAQRDAVDAKGSSLFGDDNGDNENNWILEMPKGEGEGLSPSWNEKWTCYHEERYGSEMPGLLFWEHADLGNRITVWATPGFGDDEVVNNTPIELSIEGHITNLPSIKTASFENFEQYADAMKSTLDKIEEKFKPKASNAPIQELEKPSYVTDDSEDEKGFIVPGDEEDFVDGFEETRDNAQRAFVDAIESLRMMSFEDDDIIDMFNTAFNAK